MKVINIILEDFVNYKKPSIFIGFPYCTFKCNKDAGRIVCQNYKFRNANLIDISKEEIVQMYLNNPLTSAIVFGGFEPFDTFYDMIDLITEFRKHTYDDIVIYTGYTEDEIDEEINILSEGWSNIIVKFGRFEPDTIQHIDPILGVKLFGNQYAKKLSNNL